MLHTIRRYTRIGNGLKERMQIKGFKTSEAMHKFLNSQDNNTWKVTSEPDYYGAFHPDLAKLKPGWYAMAGGQWHNMKNLDPSILAHV